MLRPYGDTMKTLIFGAGNLLLSDEGFGVHCIRYLEAHYDFPPEVELYDGGTLGIMVSHKFEEADRVYLVDVVDVAGEAGEVHRYEKEDIMLNRLPIKLSPHQIGIQEMLMVCEMRDRCPDSITVLGVVPASLDAGNELSPPLRKSLEKVALFLVEELRREGLDVRERGNLSRR